MTIWSNEERQFLHELGKAGYAVWQQAILFDTTEGAIFSAIRHHTLYPDRKGRKCLKCRNYFGSEWEGNRRCDSCKNQDGE